MPQNLPELISQWVAWGAEIVTTRIVVEEYGGCETLEDLQSMVQSIAPPGAALAVILKQTPTEDIEA